MRRRLSEAEEAMVGPACDIRRTEEAQRRYAAALRFLPVQGRYAALMEMNQPG